MNNIQRDKLHVVWEPIRGTSQELALSCPCQHILFTGTRGPGKTSTQLMRYRRNVGIGYGKFWRGIILDREYKNLSDLIAQSHRFFEDFEDGAVFKSSPSECKWEWPTGEQLLFRHVKSIEDYDNFHGHEYPFIGWNELTKYPTAELYNKFMSTNRCSFDPVKNTPKLKDENGEFKTDKHKNFIYNTSDGKPLPPIPLEVFSTTNSGGPGHNWVKTKFIDPASFGTIIRKKILVYDPKLKVEREVERTQVAIFGTFKENIYLDAQYIAGLIELTNKDSNLKKSWLEGSWDVTAGGMFDDLWDYDTHTLPENLEIPKNAYIDRSFDWGSSHPFSTGFWAELNGEELKLPDGSVLCPPAGSLIRIEEWYGAEEIGTNKGLQLSPFEIAEGILKIESELVRKGKINQKPWPGPADNQIFNVNSSDEDTIALKMEKKGILWERSNKNPGSRVNGADIFRAMLYASKTKNPEHGPQIYFLRNCKASIAILPSLPRDSKKIEDVDTFSEDHVWDEIRYRVLKGRNRIATTLNVKYGM